MPKKKEEKKEVKNFAEFSYEGTTFSYTGRVYRPEEGKGKILKSAYVSLTLNGVFTLKGCYLKETEESYFLSLVSLSRTSEICFWKSLIRAR